MQCLDTARAGEKTFIRVEYHGHMIVRYEDLAVVFITENSYLSGWMSFPPKIGRSRAPRLLCWPVLEEAAVAETKQPLQSLPPVTSCGAFLEVCSRS